jgi:hypothetical protein
MEESEARSQKLGVRSWKTVILDIPKITTAARKSQAEPRFSNSDLCLPTFNSLLFPTLKGK